MASDCDLLSQAPAESLGLQQAVKELTLLQVVVAARGASAGTYSSLRALISACLPRESLLGQVFCQAGWEQLLAPAPCSLLPKQ